MRVPKQFKYYQEVQAVFSDLSQKIRSGELNLGRAHYTQTLLHGVVQAIHRGYKKLAAVEFGVAHGHGLLELCRAAEYFRDNFDMDIAVYGFDTGTGMPEPKDYRDHPEIFSVNQFRMADPEALRKKLPSFGKLILGDIADTLKGFEKELGERKLGFVSLDVDYYSSTREVLKIFEYQPNFYVPAVPLYVDDIHVNITYSKWCGEGLAIEEFNASHDLRKIEYRPQFNVHNFFTTHIFDHPIRQGKQKPLIPTECVAY